MVWPNITINISNGSNCSGGGNSQENNEYREKFEKEQDKKYGGMGALSTHPGSPETSQSSGPEKGIEAVEPTTCQMGITGTILEGIKLPDGEPYLTVTDLVASNNLEIGDPIEFEDNVLRHWALYAGEQEPEGDGPTIPMVVHFFSVNGKPHEVRYDTLKTASDGKRCRVNKKYDTILPSRPADEIMRAAHRMIGRRDYNLITYNCEHFMTECRYGFAVSEQVQEAQNSNWKKFEIVRHVVRTGFSTATYSIKGLFIK